MTQATSYETLAFAFAEVKADAATPGVFEGYASTFGNKDLQNDIVMPGAFTETIRRGKDWPILWQHNYDEPIGVNLAAKEDEKGLWVKGQLNLDIQRGREAYSLLNQGALKAMSIGFRIGKDGAEWDKAREVRRIKSVDLLEYSIVTFPANPKARLTSLKGATVRDIEEALRDAGFSRKESTAMASLWNKLQNPQGEPGGVDQAEYAALAEAVRLRNQILRG